MIRWAAGPSGLPPLGGDRSYCVSDRTIRWSRGPSGLPPLGGDRSYQRSDRMLRWFPSRSGLADRIIRWYTGPSGVRSAAREGVFKHLLSLPPSFLPSGALRPFSLLLLGAPVCILPILSERLRIDDRRAGTSSSRSSPPIHASFSCFVGRISVSKVCSVLPPPFPSLTRLRC